MGAKKNKKTLASRAAVKIEQELTEDDDGDDQEPPYEILRRQKIAERDEMMRRVGITSLRDNLITDHKKKLKQTKVASDLKRLERSKILRGQGPTRRSARLIIKQPIKGNLTQAQKKILMDEKSVKIELSNEMVRSSSPTGPNPRPEGDLDALEYFERDAKVHDDVVNMYYTCLNESKKTEERKSEKRKNTIKREMFTWSEEVLSNLELPDWERVKVVKQRPYSMDIHPSHNRGVLFAFGDKLGQVGLCVADPSELDSTIPETHQWSPHSRTVNCVKFSRDSPVLYSASWDSTVRAFDLQQQKFLKIYRDIDGDSIKYFDINNHDPSRMVLCTHLGHAIILDMRDISNYTRFDLVNAKLRTVHFNPTNPTSFVTADMKGNASLWDLRYLKLTKSRKQDTTPSPLYTIPHAKSINCAFFSDSGNRLLTCCTDDTINVWDVNAPNAKKIKSIEHDNFTGRWLTKFEPHFVPGSDNLILSGSMSRNRKVDVINVDRGASTLALSGNSTICSIVKAHPTLPVVIGANASGYAHIWK